jgi:beta-glucanase (GH16 family)
VEEARRRMSIPKSVKKASIVVAFIITLAYVLTLTQQGVLSSSIKDSFDSWDFTIWKISNYTVSYGRFNPANVEVSGGMLRLSVPAGLNEGGQIQTLQRFSYSRFGCRMKTNSAVNTCTALFTYYEDPGAVGCDQIAAEIYSGKPEQMLITTYRLDKPTNEKQWKIVELGFDSSVAFHEYEIAWYMDHVDICVDGTPRARLSDTNYLPTHSQRFLLTCWCTSWKACAPVTATASIDSAWIRPLT